MTLKMSDPAKVEELFGLIKYDLADIVMKLEELEARMISIESKLDRKDNDKPNP